MFTVEEFIFICLMLLFLSCHMLISLPRVISFYPSTLASSLVLSSKGSLWSWENYYRIPTTQGISSVLRWLLVPLPSRIESSHNKYRGKNKERKGPHWASTLVLSMALPVMIVVVIDIDTCDCSKNNFSHNLKHGQDSFSSSKNKRNWQQARGRWLQWQ